MAQKPRSTSRKPPSKGKAPETDVTASSGHPEEMRASGEILVGKYIHLKGTARVTPAGLICAGIAGVAILMAAAMLVRAARKDA